MILDLHVHTSYSFDSLMRPAQALKKAKERGLNGIAITDHNTIRGGLEATRLNEDAGFVVIIGCEFQTETGELIGLFLREEIYSRDSYEVIKGIRDQGGIVVLPHPFTHHHLSDALLEKIDAIEGFNARIVTEGNLQAQELARDKKLPVVAGSDAHWPVEVGMGRLILENEIRTIPELKRAIGHGQGKIEGDYYHSPLPILLSELVKVCKLKQWRKSPRLTLRILRFGLRGLLTARLWL